MVEKLTLPPLPSLARLAAAVFGADGAAAAAQVLRHYGEGTVLFARSAWAMQALTASATQRLGRAPVVWLPDYFCDSATRPLRANGAGLRHYPITEALVPDWVACRAMATAGAPDIFVLVHYFGMPADGVAAAAFCRATGASLVEDAAHLIEPAGDIGRHGDAVFYSPHKLLAMPQGAALRLRDPAAALFPDLPILAPVQADATWLVKRSLQVLLPAALLGAVSRGGPASMQDDGDTAPPLPPVSCSVPALAMWARALADIPAVIERRRRNWRRIVASAGRVAGWQPVLPAGDDWVPYRAIMQCDDAATAERLYGALRAQGCPVESWPDMAREVVEAPAGHDVALWLRRTRLFLPVHQTLDVDGYCRRLEACGGIG